MNTRINLNLQSDLSLTNATFSEPTISSPTGLIQGDISGLTSSLVSLAIKDTSIDSRISAENSTRTSADASLTTRISIEESARSSADTSLTTRVSTEESARLKQDNSFITAINGFGVATYQYITFSGLINDVNTVYTNTTNDLSRASFTQVYLNGLLQDSSDYTKSFGSTNSTITFSDAPEAGAKIKVLVFWVPSLSLFDNDAEAFLIVAGITDETQKSAVNQLVLDLKSYGLWTKVDALYPFVGGSATTHKYNLKNPLDTDAAFRLTFVGGVTHNSNGVTFNGTNGYANTQLSPASTFTNASTHIALYSRTAAARSGLYSTDIGQGVGFNDMVLAIRRSNNQCSYVGSVGNSDPWVITATVTDGSGVFIGTNESTTSQKIYRNTSVIANRLYNGAPIGANQTFVNQKFYIAAYNASGTPAYYANYNCALCSMGKGFNQTEVNNYYTAVQTYQTTLGRQV
jgi:hypothetical protein